MRRFLTAFLVVVLLVVGYAALDVYDVAPGILTRASSTPTPRPVPSPTATAVPTTAIPTVDAGAVPLQVADAKAPLPSAAGVAAALRKAAADPALGPDPGFVVRDAFTGQLLYSEGADRPRVAASTGKLLTAIAVATTLDTDATLPTRVVQDATPTELVLVAGGDTMLATGKGDPTKVEGHAGLGDLASQVAAALQPTGATTVTLRLDVSYARGDRWAPGWHPADIAAGYTGGVSMLGLAGQRAVPFKPAPRDPEAATASAFVAALKAVGVTARLTPPSTWRTPVAAAAPQLGEVRSAPVGDILALALADSDNALTEGLARQAVVKAGGPPTFAAAVDHVEKTVAAQGVDLTGVTLKDTSGLTSGQAIPPRVLSDVLQLGADGRVPAMQDVIAALPVAGLTGTLKDRFRASTTRSVAGLARAKTGTLTGASSVAGTVVDADGRVLSFVAVADRLPAGVGTLAARAALDRFVATLATCGCR